MLGGLLAGAVFGAGAVVLLDRRSDPSPLLGNTGSTLARVSTLRDRDAPDAVINDLSAPGLDLGEVLRRDGDGPWRRQAIDLDRVATPYIAATAICGSAQDVLIAAGNVGVDLSGTVLVNDVKAAVPTVWRSLKGRPWMKVSVAGAPSLSSLQAIVSTRTSGRSDGLVVLGMPLRQGQDPFVTVSDDCGRFTVSPASVRRRWRIHHVSHWGEKRFLVASVVDHAARHSELERERRQQSVSARVARQISSSSSMPSRPTRIVSNARRIGCRLSNDAAHTLDKPCCAPSATSVGMLRTVRVTGATMIDDRTEIASFRVTTKTGRR